LGITEHLRKKAKQPPWRNQKKVQEGGRKIPSHISRAKIRRKDAQNELDTRNC